MKYKVGKRFSCPVCHSPKAKIVWVGKERKVVAVQCPRSHKHKRKSVILLDIEGAE